MTHVLNRITAPLGTAITGTILVAVHRTRLDSAALPATVPMMRAEASTRAWLRLKPTENPL